MLIETPTDIITIVCFIISWLKPFLDNSKNILLMSISFSVRHHQPKRRLVSEYQHCNFIRLSDIYP